MSGEEFITDLSTEDDVTEEIDPRHSDDASSSTKAKNIVSSSDRTNVAVSSTTAQLSSSKGGAAVADDIWSSDDDDYASTSIYDGLLLKPTPSKRPLTQKSGSSRGLGYLVGLSAKRRCPAAVEKSRILVTSDDSSDSDVDENMKNKSARFELLGTAVSFEDEVLTSSQLDLRRNLSPVSGQSKQALEVLRHLREEVNRGDDSAERDDAADECAAEDVDLEEQRRRITLRIQVLGELHRFSLFETEPLETIFKTIAFANCVPDESVRLSRSDGQRLTPTDTPASLKLCIGEIIDGFILSQDVPPAASPAEQVRTDAAKFYQLKFQTQSRSNTVCLTVDPTRKFVDIRNQYASHIQATPEKIQFFFDGDEIADLAASPESLGVENMDVIDVVLAVCQM